MARKKRFFPSWMLPAMVSATLLLAGCGTRKQEWVSGSVTLDGQPLTQAKIILHPLGVMVGKTVDGTVMDGKYVVEGEGAPIPGNYRVEFSQPIKTGKMVSGLPSGVDVEATEERLPPKYNRQSTLTLDLKPGKNEKNFALTSK